MFSQILKKLSCFHYNIGFFPFNEGLFIKQPEIRWMKHLYKDRFFADPFILDIKNDVIEVLVEEFIYKEWKGRITLLTVDRNSFELVSRKVLLDLKTHLSFPFIFRENPQIYVAPENSKSGQFSIYEYDDNKQQLTYVNALVKLPLVDSIIYKYDNKYYILGSIQNGNENRELYLWTSDSLFGIYTPNEGILVKLGYSSSRRAGDIFLSNNELYSASQSCVKSYGEKLYINRILKITNHEFKEKSILSYSPQSPYDEGIHTFNTYKGMCVVDGLSYLFLPQYKLNRLLR